MTPVSNTMYRFIHCFCHKVRRMWDMLHTYMRISGNGVEHSTYHCYGVPIIQRKKGCHIIWGKAFTMNNGLDGNLIGFNVPCIFRADGGNITIGDNVGMSQTTMVAKDGGDIVIGDNVLLGGGVKIYSSDFHSLNYKHRRDRVADSRNRKSAAVTIEDDCFIGAGTIILKGVTIGARSIIGAGSVVTHTLPADSICGGNPATVIKGINYTE